MKLLSSTFALTLGLFACSKTLTPSSVTPGEGPTLAVDSGQKGSSKNDVPYETRPSSAQESSAHAAPSSAQASPDVPDESPVASFPLSPIKLPVIARNVQLGAVGTGGVIWADLPLQVVDHRIVVSSALVQGLSGSSMASLNSIDGHWPNSTYANYSHPAGRSQSVTFVLRWTGKRWLELKGPVDKPGSVFGYRDVVPGPGAGTYGLWFTHNYGQKWAYGITLLKGNAGSLHAFLPTASQEEGCVYRLIPSSMAISPRAQFAVAGLECRDSDTFYSRASPKELLIERFQGVGSRGKITEVPEAVLEVSAQSLDPSALTFLGDTLWLGVDATVSKNEYVSRLLKSDGEKWSREEFPEGLRIQQLVGRGTALWAIAGGHLLHLDAGKWSRIQLDKGEKAEDLKFDDEGNAWLQTDLGVRSQYSVDEVFDANDALGGTLEDEKCALGYVGFELEEFDGESSSARYRRMGDVVRNLAGRTLLSEMAAWETYYALGFFGRARDVRQLISLNSNLTINRTGCGVGREHDTSFLSIDPVSGKVQSLEPPMRSVTSLNQAAREAM